MWGKGHISYFLKVKFFLVRFSQLLINFSFNFNVVYSFTICELCFFLGVELGLIVVIFAGVGYGYGGVSNASSSLFLSWRDYFAIIFLLFRERFVLNFAFSWCTFFDLWGSGFRVVLEWGFKFVTVAHGSMYFFGFLSDPKLINSRTFQGLILFCSNSFKFSHNFAMFLFLLPLPRRVNTFPILDTFESKMRFDGARRF